MIQDAETISANRFVSKVYDVCVIGSGPAGVTLARRLGAKGLSVGLFEAGGRELTPDSQDLYKGTIGAQPYFPLEGARLRFFGGSSNHWGGWTRPLDDHDFEVRDDHPQSGWPIAKSDLDPFAAEADLSPDKVSDMVQPFIDQWRPVKVPNLKDASVPLDPAFTLSQPALGDLSARIRAVGMNLNKSGLKGIHYHNAFQKHLVALAENFDCW